MGTSHRCCIMRKVICKEVTAGGRFDSFLVSVNIPTMSAKSLGTFPVICAIDEVQNPLPLKTMLFKRHMTSIIGISDTFPNS